MYFFAYKKKVIYLLSFVKCAKTLKMPIRFVKLPMVRKTTYNKAKKKTVGCFKKTFYILTTKAVFFNMYGANDVTFCFF